MAQHRPGLFMHTVNTLLHGTTADELSAELHKVIEAARKTGKKGSLTLALAIKPVGRDTGQYEIRDKITSQVPELDKGMTLMFGTPEGNLQREDPRQKKLDLRQAPEKTPVFNDNQQENQ